jgi:site-specific DNA recombinase
LNRQPPNPFAAWRAPIGGIEWSRALREELQSIAEQTRERATYLRLAETLSAFLARLREAADTLDIGERQSIVRLLIKDVLVGDDTIVIRHCIPVPSEPPDGGSRQHPDSSHNGGDSRSYLFLRLLRRIRG